MHMCDSGGVSFEYLEKELALCNANNCCHISVMVVALWAETCFFVGMFEPSGKSGRSPLLVYCTDVCIILAVADFCRV